MASASLLHRYEDPVVWVSRRIARLRSVAWRARGRERRRDPWKSWALRDFFRSKAGCGIGVHIFLCLAALLPAQTSPRPFLPKEASKRYVPVIVVRIHYIHSSLHVSGSHGKKELEIQPRIIIPRCTPELSPHPTHLHLVSRPFLHANLLTAPQGRRSPTALSFRRDDPCRYMTDVVPDRQALPVTNIAAARHSIVLAGLV
jgi:hypothetical protein